MKKSPVFDNLSFKYKSEYEQLPGKVKGHIMKGEFTAIIESAPEGGYWAICPEIPGANGQGETVEEAKASLKQAIILILEDRLEDIRRGLPDDAIQEIIAI